MDIVLLIGGLLLILVGANALTDGAASVAKRFNISSLVIGLTIVAFGTSAPELTVSVVSALKGSSDIAIGNVVGSNIFNALMIVGCTAAIVPISVTKGTLSKEIPLCVLASIVLFICANDVLINGASQNSISSSDGMLLLCFFAIFLGYTFAIAHNGEENGESTIKIMPIWKASLFIIGGLAGLIYGGQFFVDGASGIARGLGVSESIIGSNLFNIFFVLGCSATITPMNIQGITNLDLGVMIGSCVLLYIFGLFFKKRTITRPEGILLIACYIAYITYLIVG